LVMIRRIVALVLAQIGTYGGYVTIDIGVTMVGMRFQDGWLGPEPELLYLLVGLLIAALFIWQPILEGWGCSRWREAAQRSANYSELNEVRGERPAGCSIALP
jgi:hypothetical protein